MNLVADEGVDRQIVEQLRSVGHDVVYVAELAPSTSDDAVLQQANDRQAILITIDKDFGELVFRLNRVAAGVVLIRLEGLTTATKARSSRKRFATTRQRWSAHLASFLLV
jgi:predicted nuclease of predicted toxin-antitoxin system